MVSGYIRHSQTNNNIYFGCSLIVALKFELLRLFMLHHFYPVLKRLATVFFASHSFNQPTNTSFPSSSPYSHPRLISSSVTSSTPASATNSSNLTPLCATHRLYCRQYAEHVALVAQLESEGEKMRGKETPDDYEFGSH